MRTIVHQPHLFLDLDGVLADFAGGARRLLGMPIHVFQQRYAAIALWKKLSLDPGFFTKLAVLPDAMELFESVRHLHPTILTGLPMGPWAAPQKKAWVKRHFPDTPVITTMAWRKNEHCKPGDVLVDDQDRYRLRWEGAGGIFIHHTSAKTSIAALHELGLVK